MVLVLQFQRQSSRVMACPPLRERSGGGASLRCLFVIAGMAVPASPPPHRCRSDPLIGAGQAKATRLRGSCLDAANTLEDIERRWEWLREQNLAAAGTRTKPFMTAKGLRHSSAIELACVAHRCRRAAATGLPGPRSQVPRRRQDIQRIA